MSDAYASLIDKSKAQKTGLVFYVQGQTIAGVVKEAHADHLVVANQTYGLIVIRRDRIDAVAGN